MLEQQMLKEVLVIKKTWDTPFENHFVKFVREANKAVFDNNKKNMAFQNDIFDWKYTKPDSEGGRCKLF